MEKTHKITYMLTHGHVVIQDFATKEEADTRYMEIRHRLNQRTSTWSGRNDVLAFTDAMGDKIILPLESIVYVHMPSE